MLEYLGYKVTVMTSSVEALDLFKANPNDFDLVMTDQVMPKMSGVELTKELLRIKPELPVVLCSGYSTKVTEVDAKEIGIRAFCAKPLEMQQLATVTRDVLDTGK
jgi:DNA-binding NtrC family response regulator